MKLSVKRITALLMTALLLCLCLAPAATAEEGAADAAAQETAEPTEAPKLSAAQLQAQGILTVGAKGEDVKKLQQRLKDLGYLSGKVDGAFGGGTKRAVIAFQLLLLASIIGYVQTLSLVLLQIVNQTGYTLKIEFLKKPVDK